MSRRPTVRRSDDHPLHARVGIGLALLLLGLVWVSYNALSGLPWQSTYEISVELPNASRLVKNDSVRIGGVRVGRVASVESRPGSATRPPYAVARLALEESAAPLPIDTQVRTRAASLLGASYIALEPGISGQVLDEGGALHLENATRSVNITDVFEVFDQRTSARMQAILGELGDGFAGRGPALGDALASLPPLLRPTTRVMATLAAPHTRLNAFLRGYDAFAQALGPVSDDLANLARGGADTFAALAAERAAVAATLVRLPKAETAVTAALTNVRPALDGLGVILDDLRPGARVLPPALRAVNAALDEGTPAIRRVPAFADRLRGTLAVVAREARRPSSGGVLRKGAELLQALRPTIKDLEEMQVHCNSIGITLETFSALTVDNTITGSTVFGTTPLQYARLAVTHVGAEGEVFQQAKPSRNVALNYLPNANAQECEAGNELHDGATQILTNPPGNQAKTVPSSDIPEQAVRHARAAGLLDKPEGWQP